MVHILYNALAANKHGEEQARALRERYAEGEYTYEDIATVADMQAYVDALVAGDTLILAGGDGTLNRFINSIEDKDYPADILLYPDGSGNDFYNDVKADAIDGMIRLNPYIKDLPTVSVNGKTQKFINGIGYGIDGYCCEIGDKLHEKSDAPINYAGIAIKGLLFHFKPANAEITVDGVTETYRKVWLAPTMNGRYYGGGMDIAPDQDRLNGERLVSSVVMHGSGKIKTLVVFPSIFKGEHVKHGEMVKIRAGKTVTVKFDRPCALQIDGETVLGVTEYTVRSSKA